MAKVDGRKNRKKKKVPLTKAQRKRLSDAMRGNKNGVGNDGGRPSDYDSKKARHIYRMLLMMMPIKEICEIHGISQATFFRWKEQIPEFRELVYKGQYGADEKIIVSLKRKAYGYSHKVVKPMKIKNAMGEDEIVDHVYVENHPPDVRAIELFLKNRENTKLKWSNLPGEEIPPAPTITINNNTVDLSKLSDSAIREIIRASNPGNVKG